MKRSHLHAVILLVLFAGAHLCKSSTIAWTNTAGGNWSSVTNWDPNQLPGTNDTAVITTNGTYTVILDEATTIGGLDLGGTDGTQTLSIVSRIESLTLNGPGFISTSGVLNLGSAYINGSGPLTVSGT